MFINLLVIVIYLVVDNIKRTNLTQNMKIKKCWLREQDLNLRPLGHEPGVHNLTYDRIVAITKNTIIRDQEEKNKTFTIY